jgi:xanthine dehydrogenase accessory factor
LRGILSEIDRWKEQGKNAALATVVRMDGSGPTPLGSKMAVSSSGEMVGSVSGGCVEGAVVEEALEVLRTARPKLVRFGISDERAWEVGLACGGTIEVFIEPVDLLPSQSRGSPMGELLDLLKQSLARQQLAAIATIVAGLGVGSKLIVLPDGQNRGSLGHEALDDHVLRLSMESLVERRSHLVTCEALGEPVDVFIEVHSPQPELIIVGAVHIAVPLVTIAKTLGFRTTVVDARSAFATEARFSHADRVILQWPSKALEEMNIGPSCYIVVLTHDEKLDNPALKIALKSRASYVGALGAKRTHANRLKRLEVEGVPEKDLSRIHAPIGLDIGAERPEEIALSIMAEVVAVSRGMHR